MLFSSTYCINSNVRSYPYFFILSINKENAYSEGTGNISSFLNSPLQEHLESTPITVFITLFWSKKYPILVG
jgi:hypothetical protein